SSRSSLARLTGISPVHHASLVDPSTHSPALLQLLDINLSKQMIDYVVDCAADVVDFAQGRPTLSVCQRISRRTGLAKFTKFVTNVLTRSEVTTPIILSSLVYINRAMPHLYVVQEEWALERVFLGALIVASKARIAYLNDSAMQNTHWAACTGVLGKREVGIVEREFLDVLNWDLRISEENILAHYDGVSDPGTSSPSYRRVASSSPNADRAAHR
ncbi:hypothetical protein F5051DRAFT_315472, partial [Lentinula edodes]